MRHSTDLTSVVQSRLRSLVASRERLTDTSGPEEVFVDVDPRTTRSVGRVIVAVVVLVGIGVWLNRPMALPKSETLESSIPLSTSSLAPTSFVVVDVEGDVRRPGLVRLPVGSRVADAISAAGGLTHKQMSQNINLASRLEDGQQIIVGQSINGSMTSDNRISLNTANESDFDTLPGVGPVLASRIVAWRTQHQRFASVDELQEVPGIGPKVFANLKDLVRL